MRDESDLTPLEVLRSVFGYPTFRPHQQQIVEAALAGRNVLAVMPTSAGKSVCYQVPALVRAAQGAGATVVVSPLISLMADQVQALAQADVSAACLNSAMAAEDRAAVLEDVRRGRLALLYVAPERLGTSACATPSRAAAWRFSPWTRRTASRSGATTSGLATSRSAIRGRPGRVVGGARARHGAHGHRDARGARGHRGGPGPARPAARSGELRPPQPPLRRGAPARPGGARPHARALVPPARRRERHRVDALGRDSRQRRLLLDLAAVAVEPALPPVPAVIRCSPAPVPVLRDGMPVHTVPPGNLREVRPDAALPVRIQFSHEIPLQGPTPLRRRFGAEPSW